MPCPLHTHRSPPGYNVLNQLANSIKILQRIASAVCKYDFYDIGWKLAMLPINLNVIGLATSIDTAIPAYAAAITASLELTSRILFHLFASDLSSEQKAICHRWTAAGFDLVVQPKSQCCSTRIAAASKHAEVMSCLDPSASLTSLPHLNHIVVIG